MRKINVLYVCHAPENLGGAALSLAHLIESLKDYVNPIVLLQDYGIVYNYFKIKKIDCIIEKFEENIRSKNIVKHYILFIPKYIRYIVRNKICVYKVGKRLHNIKIDIVHSNSSVFTIGVYLSKELNSKHVWHIREFQDIDFGIVPFLGWKNLKKQIYNADAIIAITHSIYTHWELENKTNSFYVWDAIYKKEEITFNPNKEKYFIFCAAFLCDEKGADFALRSFGISKLAQNGYRLKMIGKYDNNYLIKLNRIALKYRINNNVDYLGYCSNIKDYMSKAKALLMCSMNEGLGRVTIEAMFCGCPVIARDSGGTLEFLINNKNGFLFHDENECAFIMKKLTTLDITKIIYNSQMLATKSFSEEMYCISILNIYKKVL